MLPLDREDLSFEDLRLEYVGLYRSRHVMNLMQSKSVAAAVMLESRSLWHPWATFRCSA